MNIKLYFILLSTICAMLSSCVSTTAPKPTQPTVKPFYGNKDWVIVEDIPFKTSQPEIKGVVPAGFVTDFASVPRPIWAFLSPYGTYSPSAIAHDYLYWYQPFPKNMSQSEARKTADLAMLKMMERDGVSWLQRHIIHKSLRIGGSKAWNQNKRNHDSGMRKTVPSLLIKSIPFRSTWPQYRAYLDKQKIPK